MSLLIVENAFTTLRTLLITRSRILFKLNFALNFIFFFLRFFSLWVEPCTCKAAPSHFPCSFASKLLLSVVTRLQNSRFRKAKSAVSVILECEAREPHTLQPFVRIDLYHAAAILSPRRTKSFVFARLVSHWMRGQPCEIFCFSIA